MADTRAPEVSRHEFSIAYDGAALASDQHSIDVQALAPALLAFGKLIREANTEFNGKKSTAKVLVVSDFEHKCFNINFEVIVSLYEQLKTLLASEPVKTAQDVLEWLGLLGVPTSAVGGLSYLAFLKWKNGRKVEEAKPLTDVDRTGIVEVKVVGDGNSVHVHNHVYKLSENPRAFRATRDAFLPLGQDGFDNETEDPEIETTTAWLSVYSPVFDAAAPNWRFRLGRDVIYADITATDIAQKALERGGVNVDDSYQVKLEITTETDPQGVKKEPTYRILEVVRFVGAEPALRQGRLFEPPERT